jgi:hypothetical protein
VQCFLKSERVVSPKNQPDRWKSRERGSDPLAQNSVNRIGIARPTDLAFPGITPLDLCKSTVVWIEVQINALVPDPNFLIWPNCGLKIIDRLFDERYRRFHRFFVDWIAAGSRADPTPPAVTGSAHEAIVFEIPDNPLHHMGRVRADGAPARSMQLNDPVDEVTTLPLGALAKQFLSDMSDDGSCER